MKLVVFAHTPPPHHGQSYMVEVLLRGFAGKKDIRCFHVNARVSDDLQDVGSMRPGKILRFLGYCFEAIWCRLRHGADVLYYVPAPAKKSAILRDWLVMALVRPWFKKTIFHWHAFGLGHWVAGKTEHPSESTDYAVPPPPIFGKGDSLAKRITFHLLRKADMAIVLTEYSRGDAVFFEPRRIEVVPNGIEDPCPDFATSVLPRRLEKISEGREQRVLFLAHCTKEKGLFDAMGAVEEANGPEKIFLSVAGGFLAATAQAKFEERSRAINEKLGFSAISYLGFLSGPQKDQALRDHDILCFPTTYAGEGLPVSIVEALAYGLPVVATRWRGIPDILPPKWPFLCAPQDVPALAAAIRQCAEFRDHGELRQRYLERYEISAHISAMRLACLRASEG